MLGPTNLLKTDVPILMFRSAWFKKVKMICPVSEHLSILCIPIMVLALSVLTGQGWLSVELGTEVK
jgi:hypothetical protein